MRIDAVRKLWDRLRAVGGRALDDESESFTSSELAVGRMVLPLLEDLEAARKAVDELTASTRALRIALDLLPVAAIVLDDRGRYLTSNAAARRLLGGAAVSDAVVEAAAHAVSTGTEMRASTVTRLNGTSLRVVPAHLGRAAGQERASVAFLVPDNARPEVATDLLMSRYGLSPMQAKVVGHVARGLTNKEIAAELGISSETVHKHLNAVFQRTGLSTRAAVVALAFGAPYGVAPAEVV